MKDIVNREMPLKERGGGGVHAIKVIMRNK